MEIDCEEEARRVLWKLHSDGTNDEWIQQEFHEIKTTIAAEKAITVPGWRIMFTVPQWRTRLMHGVAVQVFTQFTGINVIGYVSTTIGSCSRSPPNVVWTVTIKPRCTALSGSQGTGLC